MPSFSLKSVHPRDPALFPAPWRGWSAVDLTSETELIHRPFCFEEEPEHVGCRRPVGQGGGLLVCARLPQDA